MSEIRYFIDGRWIPASQLPQSIIDSYNAGMMGAQPKIDPSTGDLLRTDDGEIDYEAIPMSGGYGDETLAGGTFTAPASARIDRVDPRLVDAARTAAAPFAYDVEVTPHGGRNSRGKWGTPNHPGGWALDFTLVDPATGERLDNYRDPSTFRTYEQYAQAIKGVVDQQYPELSDQIRFGGYFGGRWGFDQMHVDITPSANQAMSQGSWEYGLGQDRLGNPIPLPAKWRNVASVGMLEGSEIPTMDTSEPVASRVASDLDVPPSWPSPQEAARMLAERGYTGPDAIMAFQENELLSTRPSGSMDTETVAALMNPNPIAPPERPNLMAGSSGVDSLRSGRPDTLVGGIGMETPTPEEVGVSIAPNLRPDWARGRDATMESQKPPDILGGLPPKPPGGLGAVAAQPAPKGLPTPQTRPAGLGAVAQEMPGSYRRLRVGDSGADVRKVQSQLSAAGFDPGPLDGRYGPKTAAAVLAFQRTDPDRVGGKIDAIAGPFTQAALHDVTQNSVLSSLSDPGGVPRGSPSGLDVAKTIGRPSWTAPEVFDPGGGTGRDSRPPGTAPAIDRPVTTRPPLSSGDRSMITSQAFRPMEAKPWNPWGGMGATVRETPLTSPENTELNAGLTLSTPPTGSREPSPLSPASVISSMGGTGSSGLGPAGTGGLGPGQGFDSGSGMVGTDDEDTLSGYNESFSTTGWL